MGQLETAVLLIVFNRLQTVKQVLASLQLVRPKKLYIFSDGPRPGISSDYDRILEVRQFLKNEVNWNCTLEIKENDTNLGCKYGPNSAIDWFFSREERGIILEDDCVPSTDFYRLCTEILNKYEDDMRVFGVSGTNFFGKKETDSGYYFSNFFMIWGWASWRSRWTLHKQIMQNFDEVICDPLIHSKISNNFANKEIIKNATRSHKEEIDAWDYLWIFSCFVNNGLVVVPNVNTVTNIGFGMDATHTKNFHQHRINTISIDWPLRHPTNMIANEQKDNLLYNQILGWIPLRHKLSNPRHLLGSFKTRWTSMILKI